MEIKKKSYFKKDHLDVHYEVGISSMPSGRTRVPGGISGIETHGGMKGAGTRGQKGVHPSALLDRVLTWRLRGVIFGIYRWASGHLGMWPLWLAHSIALPRQTGPEVHSLCCRGPHGPWPERLDRERLLLGSPAPLPHRIVMISK